MMDKKEDTRKKTILVAVVAVIILLILGVMTVIFNNMPVNTEREGGTGELVRDQKDKLMVFYNFDFVTLTYNLRFSTDVMEKIEELVLSDEEMEFSGENAPAEEDAEIYYDATIDVGSLEFEDLRVKFRLTISDGREYSVVAETDKYTEDYEYAFVGILRGGGEEISVLSSGALDNLNEFMEFCKSTFGKTVAKRYNYSNE